MRKEHLELIKKAADTLQACTEGKISSSNDARVVGGSLRLFLRMLEAEKRPLSESEVLDVLGKVKAVLTDGHFVYTSGKHGTAYVNKDAVHPHTEDLSRLCLTIAHKFKDDNVEVVVAPAIGGVAMAQWTAHWLTLMTGREVMAVYAQKETVAIPDPEEKGRKCFAETGKFVIERGQAKHVAGKRALVLEDITTTGSTVKLVVEIVRATGGDVIGVGILCNRGGVTGEQIGDVPALFALVNVKLDAWDEDQIPDWLRERPVNTDVGKGKEWLERQKQT